MKRVFSLFLALILLLSLTAPAVSAAPATKKEVTRAISVVFDNSGSMYKPPNNSKDTDFYKTWCRATYAMEVFAKMMNAQDVMYIYPMHPVKATDGQTYNLQKPLQVTQATADLIHDLYTPAPSGTPIESLEEAIKSLDASSADEKWLLVLTDGATYDRGEAAGRYQAFSKEQTKKEVAKVLNQHHKTANIIYLAVGADVSLPDASAIDSGSGNRCIIKHAANSADVLSALTELSTLIFGRKDLKNVKKQVSFDVSMSKLIVFLQGPGIADVKLGGNSPVSVSDMKYSTSGAGGQGENFQVDETLQGTLAIFEDVAAGKYDLSYSGTPTSVACYYEPDVDLSVVLLDENENPVNMDSEPSPGTYYLQYCMVDNQGNVTNSNLLGKTEYTITYTINGETKTVTADKSGKAKIEIGPRDVLDGSYKVTYLDGYTITRTASELGWPSGGLKFAPPPAGNLEIKLSGPADLKLSTLSSADKFLAEFYYEGAKLTGNQLNSIEELAVNLEGGNVLYDLTPGSDGYYITLKYNGSALQTDIGDFKLTISGKYRNEDNLYSNTASASAAFTLADDSRSLEMKVSCDQDYYQRSKIASGDPIVVKLTYDGHDLSADELAAVELQIDSGKAVLLKEADPASSSYLLKLDPNNPPPNGDYTVKVTVHCVNEIGRELTLTGKAEFEVGTLPMWLKILIPILIILLIILLIIWFMNQKRLPKNIDLQNITFRVDGENVTGKGKVVFDGAGKKHGTIKITSPNYSMVAQAVQGMSLSVTAVSPRRTPSGQRKALVTVCPKLANAPNVTSWKLKSNTYKPDPNKPGQFLNTIGKAPFKPVELTKNTEIAINAEPGDSTVVFKGKIVFK